jgi:hypothetical protein
MASRSALSTTHSLSLLLLLLSPSSHLVAEAASSVISNVVPRVDATTGQIIDIHDGNTMRIGDTFYWFGMSYGDCQEQPTGCSSLAVGACGFNLNHNVSVATSTDLVNWTYHGPVLTPDNRPAGIMFSPWVAKQSDAAGGLFVLWVNILPVVNGQGNFDASFYAVFTSSSPLGPFHVANPNVTGLAYTSLPDAPSIFVDDDGQGYIAFTHENTHINNVQQRE